MSKTNKATKKIVKGCHPRNYFKDTEKLLYSLPALKLKVAQDEEDFKDYQIVQKRKSADVVKFYKGQSTGMLYGADEKEGEDDGILHRQSSQSKESS